MPARNIHNVLEAACKALGTPVDAYDHGVKPVLYNPTYLLLTLWIVDQAWPRVGGREEERAPIVRLASAVLGGVRLGKDDVLVLRRLMEGEPSNDAATLVRALATETWACNVNDVGGKGSRAAAAVAARALGAPFLDALDRQIDRLEAVTLVERQALPFAEPRTKIVALRWRGAAGAKLTHAIVEIEGGRFGLIAKTKGRWTWHEGSADDVLATVPDAQMESAVAAVLGGERAAPAPKAAKAVKGTVARLDEDLAAVAIDLAGRPWAATRDGRVVEWRDGELYASNASVGAIEGMDAGDDVVVTWGASLTRWRGDDPPETIADAADGALVLDDGRIVFHRGAQIALGRKKLEGFAGMRLLLDRAGRRIFAVAKGGVRAFSLDGARLFDLPLGGDGHALSPDGATLAVWNEGAKDKRVTLARTSDGALLRTLDVDAGNVDAVVFAGDRTLVRYHGRKRVAVFDARGARTHRLQARELGRPGSGVDELFALSSGLVLAFAPFPRGDTFLVDVDARLLGEWKLERFYTGGKSHLADAGERVVLAHSRDGTRILVLEIGPQ